VLIYDFLRDLNAYLATRVGVPIKTLADAIAFNEAHADVELKYFGQELFLLAQSDPFTQAEYQAALANGRMIGGPQGSTLLSGSLVSMPLSRPPPGRRGRPT